MSEEKNPFEPEPDFFSSPESFSPPPASSGEPDFFDDLDTISDPSPMEPFPHVEEESHIPPPSAPPTPPPAAKPAAASRPKKVESSDEFKPNGAPTVVSMLILGGALVGLGIGLSKLNPPAAAPEAPAAASTPTPTPAAAPAAPAPTPVSSDEFKALAAKVEELGKSLADGSKSLGALQTKVDGLPKPAPAPDLKPIETKIAAIDAKVTDLASKPATPPPAPAAMKVDLKPIETKIADLSGTVGAIPTQIEALKAQVAAQEKTIAALKKELAEKPAPAAAASTEKPATVASTEKPAASTPGMPPTPSPTTPATTDAAFNEAVGLFKQNQYGPARDAFVKLTTGSTDARVWYFAALSSGFATNQWADGSDALKYVTRGIELEKAGTPDKAKLDGTFADLRQDAKGWLDSYRAQAR